MKLRIFLLFSVLLPFIEPCVATRPLREIVFEDLINSFAVPISEEGLLKKIRQISDGYEAKILDNLQRLSVASMRDLLAFLQKDALSLQEIRTKIDMGGYKNPLSQRRHEDIFCFYHFSRYSFDEIKTELTAPTNTSEPKFRHLSEKTLKVFLEAEPLFQRYITACANIFDVTDEIEKILNKSIRYFYRNKKSEMLYDEPYKDPWHLAATASNGSWSTIVYSILPPPEEVQQTGKQKQKDLMQPVKMQPVKFHQENAEKFIYSVIKDFNKRVDQSTANDAVLKESVKQQFRSNFIEYLLRGVYAFYKTPSPERDNLVNDILEYAGKIPDDSEPQPLG